MIQVNRGFQLISKKYSNSFDDLLFVDAMTNFMYHIIDDVESVDEENYSLSVLEDWLLKEKENAMHATGQSSSHYDAIDIPDTDIFEKKDCETQNDNNDGDSSKSSVCIHVFLLFFGYEFSTSRNSTFRIFNFNDKFFLNNSNIRIFDFNYNFIICRATGKVKNVTRLGKKTPRSKGQFQRRR